MTAVDRRGDRRAVDLVIPVYNEGDAFLETLAQLETKVEAPIRLHICYDQPDDTTLRALDNYRGRLDIMPIRNQGRGAQGAILTGFRASLAPAVISYMADDVNNAGLIDEMIRLFVQGNEIVCPSRFVAGGAMIGCRWYKAVLVRLVAFSLHRLAGLPVHDPTNAFRLFSRRVLDEIPVESTEGFSYSLELLVKAHRRRWPVAELPAIWIERGQGQSRFQVFEWAPAYLRWFFYAFATTYPWRRSA
jgi:glycosyltransferase involved in cell wall biosynthesis